jgi:hypothetical protein
VLQLNRTEITVDGYQSAAGWGIVSVTADAQP